MEKPVMEDGENGHLVDVFDEKDLVQKIVAVLKHPERQVQIRENARKTIEEKYDLHTRCLPAHIELVESLGLTATETDSLKLLTD